MSEDADPPSPSLATRLAALGRTRVGADRTVNPAVQRASTVLLDTVADLYAPNLRTYGLEGLSVQDALCEALMAVEGGAGCTLTPSGLAACTLPLLALVRAGDEVLVTDSVYKPTRRFCDGMLKRLGVTTRYYPPRIGAAIADLITPQTRAVFLESPGSLTLEVQDVPAITAAAQAAGVTTLIDNTWSAGVGFRPFDHGVDISIQALTKHQAGHADVLAGAVLSRTPTMAQAIRQARTDLGLGLSPDDAYLVLRGMRSMLVRYQAQGEAALTVAQALEQRPEVAAVLHPALPSSPDHALWKRDFTAPGAVFSFVLAQPVPDERLAAMLEGMQHFAMGFSWGGFESLIVPCDPQIVRAAEPWRAPGPVIRVSIGLEDPADLIADLEAGLARLSA